MRAIVRSGCFVLAALALGGCSTSRLAVGSMTPVLENTVDSALRSEDAVLVGDGLPASLLLLEGMSETSPRNRDVSELASLLYFAYSYAYVEDSSAARASALYARGVEHAWRAADDEEFERAVREGPINEIPAALTKIGKKDAEPLLWVCANWGMWIQLNLAKTSAAADLARVLPLAERVAELDESLYWGMPRILLGALHAGRPITLGGDPARSKREFERAFAISRRNMLLAQVFFAKTWSVQTFDPESFRSSLREVIDAAPGILPDAELLNRIARRKAEALLAREEEIFE